MATGQCARLWIFPLREHWRFPSVARFTSGQCFALVSPPCQKGFCFAMKLSSSALSTCTCLVRKTMLATCLASGLAGLAHAETTMSAPTAAKPAEQKVTPSTAPLIPEALKKAPWLHADSLIGTPKYKADFKHFDYANPNAPKGGRVRQSASGSFDTFNIVPPKGEMPNGIGLIYDTLMTASLDEASTQYGLIAEAMRHPADYSSVSFRLRKEARWHDGKPVTPEDVIWSFQMLTKHSPQRAFYYRDVKQALITGPNEVSFIFSGPGNKELPHIVGQLFVLPKHYWTGMDKDGKPRDITRSTLEPPLSSGPYRIGSFETGRHITYERVKDYWGKDLAVNVGQNNFDTLRYDFFRDDTVELEQFKADKIDWREETKAKTWAKSYNFKAVKDKRIIRQVIPRKGIGIMSGFVMNLRRDIFKDIRFRKALNLMYNFEDMNKTLFFGQYERVTSYYYGSDLASTGVPGKDELAILEPLRGKVPDGLFTQPYPTPVSKTRQDYRNNLRKAHALLREAGFAFEKGKLLAPKTRKPVELTYLINGKGFEHVANLLHQQFKRLGIKLNIRVADSAEYVNRVRNDRDFDIASLGWLQSQSPGNEQIQFFGSSSADRNGSQNYAGIKNPAIDALIETLIKTKNRDKLVATVKALDRVLLWNHYVVPGWTLNADRVAYWDRFSHVDPLPAYSYGFPTIWWWDAEKAAKTGGANGQ